MGASVWIYVSVSKVISKRSIIYRAPITVVADMFFANTVSTSSIHPRCSFCAVTVRSYNFFNGIRHCLFTGTNAYS